MFGGETMLFFNEELFNNKEQLNLFMAKIQENIKFNIKILSMHKSILLNYVLKIVDEPILENSIDNALSHSENLMPMIDSAFKKANLTINDINLIVCDIGPRFFYWN